MNAQIILRGDNISMDKKVTAKQFCEEFHEQWREQWSQEKEEICNNHKDNSLWTRFMDSFLCQVSERLKSERLKLKVGREWYKMDYVYYEEDPNLIEWGIYPTACLHVYIEHENGENVEEEMWKMLFIRSPLKVLIFYDYGECKKMNNEDKPTWLQEKLDSLFEMGQKVDAKWPESNETEYLFLVGPLTSNKKEDFCWRYLVVKSGAWGEVKTNDGGNYKLTPL